MWKKWNRLLSLSLASFMLFSLVACQSASSSSSPSAVSSTPATSSSLSAPNTGSMELEENNWAPETRVALNSLLANYGINSANYDPAQKPYVVFDFDNTTSFFDVGEALLIYQLENLRFKIAPDQMYEVLTTEVPTDNFVEEYNNTQGTSLNVEIVARDCQTHYTWLCENYEGLGYGGTMTLDEVKKAPEYQDFITKVRYLYDAIGDTFDAAVSYPWVTYLFTGMTPKEVQEVATESHDYWLAYDVWEKVTWESPADLKTEAGAVSVTYKTSVALPPESVDLYNKLMANGFDVYVCSASFIDVIKAIAVNPKYGLSVPEENIYAMMLKLDEEGRYLNAYDYDNYFQTQGEGKTKTINKFIAPNYGGSGPVFVAGDSQGDYSMMTSFDETVLGLIINRVRKDDFAIISKQAAETIGDPEPRFVLQGRDENNGVYIPQQESILMGSDTPQLLNEEAAK